MKKKYLASKGLKDEYILRSSANNLKDTLSERTYSRSLLKSIKIIGLRTDPCGIPLMTLEMFDSTFSILICGNLSERKVVIDEMSMSGRPIWHNFKMSLLCTTESKAFEKSIYGMFDLIRLFCQNLYV